MGTGGIVIAIVVCIVPPLSAGLKVNEADEGTLVCRCCCSCGGYCGNAVPPTTGTTVEEEEDTDGVVVVVVVVGGRRWLRRGFLEFGGAVTNALLACDTAADRSTWAVKLSCARPSVLLSPAVEVEDRFVPLASLK